MDFVDEVRTRSGRFAGSVKNWESEPPTEEATKTSLILPFIQMLGYDIFDPTEVVPEFTADIGIKRGEKVDYAIMQRGKPAILIECKRYGSNLNLHGRSLELASLLDQGPVYDAHYLVLAEALECELWTADERFYVAARSVAQNVHWLGEFVVPEEQLYEEPCQES